MLLAGCAPQLTTPAAHSPPTPPQVAFAETGEPPDTPFKAKEIGLARRHPAFLKDYVAILEWLEKHGDAQWIRTLANGLEDVVELVSQLPGGRRAHG